MKHRDRSYIISKLNKNIQKMQQGENAEKEKKELNRIMYLENNKDQSMIAKKKEELPFTEKSEVKSPMKKRKQMKG